MAYAQDKGSGKERKRPSNIVQFWTNEIAAARRREKDYRTEGKRIREIYNGQKRDTFPFNILYSNTETLLPALYGATPKPIVQRRFKDADPVGRAAAMAGQRMLEFLIDTNIEDYETFDAAMRDSALDALLPGRGVARVRYDADVVAVPTGALGDEGEPLLDEETGEPVTAEEKAAELVCMENVCWDRVYFGYAKKWQNVPWVAFEHYMDKSECAAMFGKAIAERLTYNEADDSERDEEGSRKETPASAADQGERKTCLVYEIWKKKGKKVCFFADCYLDGYLKEEDDPLELSGFYPTPRPMAFLTKTNDLTPSALYLLYENQAKELNRISVRINRIVEAIKVRAAYDGSLGDTLNDLLKGDDNSMTPTDNASNIALQGGLDKYIWFMPLEMLAAVLKQLYAARYECKQIIYEVTGLSDIIRGASVASETATAQTIKDRWGSLRIKMSQQEVRRYVRDSLRMMLEVAAKKFSPETFAKMTGLPFTTQAAKAQAQALLQAAQQRAGQVPVGPDGKPQIPPAIQQALAQAQQTMATPDWESVIALLKDDLSRAYRIDIETNSTVQVDEQEDKALITEALGALGQFLKGVQPLVETGAMPFEASKSMLLSIVRRFRFGTEVEEEIKSMQPPKPQIPPEMQKQIEEGQKKIAQSEAQVMESKKQATEAQLRADTAEKENKLIAREASLDVRELKLEAQEAQLQIERKVAEDGLRAKEERAGERERTQKEVSSLVEQSTKREQEIAADAGGKVAQAAQAIEGVAQTVQQLEASLAALAERVTALATAKRKRTPRRGADGRIVEVIEEAVQ